MNTLRIIKFPEKTDPLKQVMDHVKSMKRLADEGSQLSPLKKLFGNFILENSLVHFPSEQGVGKTLTSVPINDENFVKIPYFTVKKNGVKVRRLIVHILKF